MASATNFSWNLRLIDGVKVRDRLAYIAPEDKHALARAMDSPTWAEPARTSEDIAVMNAKPDGEEAGSIAVNLLQTDGNEYFLGLRHSEMLELHHWPRDLRGISWGTVCKLSLLSVPQRRIITVQATVVATVLPY